MKIIEHRPAAAYDPNRMFDNLLHILQLDSDEALCAALHVPPYVITSIRCGQASISPSLLIRINELCDINIRELRSWMGDRRSQYRIGETRRPQGVPADMDMRRKSYLETDESGLPNFVQWT